MANTNTKTKNIRKGCVPIYAREHDAMKKLAHRTGMKLIRIPGLLLRGWDLLTPEQRRNAMLPPDASEQEQQTKPADADLTPVG